MKTELEIVYNILETARGGSINADEIISERLVRSFIQEYRADTIRKNYNDGHTISEIVFQTKTLNMKRTIYQRPGGSLIDQNMNPGLTIHEHEYDELFCSIPKIVNFEHNYGSYIEIFGEIIPFIDNYKFRLNRKDKFNSMHPMASLTNVNDLIVFIPYTSDFTIPLRDYVIRELSRGNKKEVRIVLHAILANPDDADNYDWTKDPFPFPEERLPELVYSILHRKIEPLLQGKIDETINSRQDSILYHENHNLSNQ